MLERDFENIRVSRLISETAPKTPEERLMMAVLQEALATLERGFHSRNPLVRQDSQDVDRWLRSRSTDDLFSFENICVILDIDADYLRAGLAVAKRNALARSGARGLGKLRRERIADRCVWRGRIG